MSAEFGHAQWAALVVMAVLVAFILYSLRHPPAGHEHQHKKGERPVKKTSHVPFKVRLQTRRLTGGRK